MSPFTTKNWVDSPSSATPITAAALEDLEQRTTDYTDDSLADFVPAATRVLSPGNLGATYTVTFTGIEDVLVIGTVNANVALSLASYVAGSSVTFDLTADATTGRVVTFPVAIDGAATYTMAASEQITVTFYAAGSSTLRGFLAVGAPVYNWSAPSDFGLKAWTHQIDTSQSSHAYTAQRLYCYKMKVPKTITIANLVYQVAVAAVNGGASQANTWMGVYNQAGSALLGKTADQSTPVQSTGVKTAAVTAESGQSLTIAGSSTAYVWITLIMGTLATTAPQLRALHNSSVITNFNLAAGATLRGGGINSIGTTLPSSVTLANLTADLHDTFGVT